MGWTLFQIFFMRRMEGMSKEGGPFFFDLLGGTSWAASYSASLLVQLEVWAKEREAAGLRASLNTLMAEIQRLNKLCAERKEAEDSLKKKWKKIEEFDARRSELETIYTALLKANMVRYLNFKISCKTTALFGGFVRA